MYLHFPHSQQVIIDSNVFNHYPTMTRVPIPFTKESFLAKCSSATSFCTGCATAEISRAILERDVNVSGKASFHMSIPTVACWATCLTSHNLLTPTRGCFYIYLGWDDVLNIFLKKMKKPLRSTMLLVNGLSRNPLIGLKPLLPILSHLASLAIFWGWCPSTHLMSIMGTVASSRAS